MSSFKNPQAPVASPCNSICTMDAQTGYCNGCKRTIDEIMRWGNASDPQKQAIVDLLDARWLDAGKLNQQSS